VDFTLEGLTPNVPGALSSDVASTQNLTGGLPGHGFGL
jgi:hypothetical protein